jgi:hypothetical protein
VVQPFPWAPKQVAKGKPAVSVWRTDLERDGLELVHLLSINLYCARTADEDAEIEAEDLLDELLISIQRLGLASWSKAERMIFDRVIGGWTITAQLRSTDHYRQTILTERATTNEP